jgi:hypothetical protein
MAQVRIDPKAGMYPEIRKGGKYGPGCPNTATCTIVGFVANVEADNAPPFDRDLDRGPYCKFTFRVEEPDQTVFHDEWPTLSPMSGGRGLTWVKAAGVPVDEDGNFDDEHLMNVEVVIQFSDPKPGKNNPDRKFTRVTGVYGIES